LEISVELVKQLRNKTGAGMMDCKKALMESGGDIEKAIEYLRKKGSLTAQKRSARIAKEGLILTRTSNDRKEVSIVEVNCETDFVARSDEFQKFTNEAVETVLKEKTGDIKLLEGKSVNGRTVKQALDELTVKVGEKLEFKRAAFFSSKDGFFCAYNHVGNKLASIIELTGSLSDRGAELGNDLAMQVAAMKPLSIDRSGIAPSVIEKEKEIYITQARNEKKPENIAEKIAANKVEKFYQENCLIEQEFIREPGGKTVGEIINAVSKETGNEYNVKNMIRYQLGETLES
jgi:elongation factor Ts